MRFSNSNRRGLVVLLLVPILSVSMLNLNNKSPQAGTLDLSATTSSITMVIGDIKGENNINVKESHSLLSYTWATFSSSSGSSGSAQDSGRKASFTEVSILKQVDGASSKVFQACVTGTVFKGVTIIHWVTQTSGGAIPYVKLELENAVCSLYAFSGTEGDTPLESLSLVFNKITFTTTQIQQDGKAGTANKVVWDVAENKEP